MSFLLSVTCLASVLLAAAPATPAPVPTATPTGAEGIRFFETQVRPLLSARCLGCHAGAAPSGNLNLGSRAGILKGGKSGPAVNVLDPTKSLLLQAINYQGRQMPPSDKLPGAEIATITRWVSLGLPWTPNDLPAPAAAATPHLVPPPVNAETKRWWSFQPVKTPAVPAVRHAGWVANPIDAFILSKLEKSGLTPARPASKVALLRRATYDLTGLPPTPEEMKAFLADSSPDAYRTVVDRLLASPRYGERWARHWLDVVRYAETNSFERDSPKPFPWRYRDYVIESFNADKPYDQFIREQLAGDELPQVTRDSIIATGFYRLGQADDEPADPLQARYDELDDIVTTTGQTFLGLTVNCARCHDHKIDPFPQKDYYRLLAFFQNITSYRGHEIEPGSLRSIASPEEQARFDKENQAYQANLSNIEAKIKTIEDVVRGDFTGVEKDEFQHEPGRIAIVKLRVPKLLTEERFQEYVSLTEQRKKLLEAPPAGVEQALCIKEDGRTAPPTHVMLRGSPHNEGDEVEPGFPSVLSPPAPAIHAPAPDVQSTGRRLALAGWLASSTNPLTARVMANRIWQGHFGRGIVRSPNNFGFQGTAPTHPELLDWLAGELVRNGWKLKPLHRMIMLSNAYRMSAQGDPAAAAKDPENNLFWRFDMRRLDAEEVRDSILAVNGTLNLKMGGPSVYPPIPKEVLAGQSRPGNGWPVSPPEEQTRRSVYVHVKRSLPLPILASFDAADNDFTCPVRFATTQPTQALSLMNSTFIHDQAATLADAARKNAGDGMDQQVSWILWRVFQRAPTAPEVARGVRLIHSLGQHSSEQEALSNFCVVALNLNEFIYLD